MKQLFLRHSNAICRRMVDEQCRQMDALTETDDLSWNVAFVKKMATMTQLFDYQSMNECVV